MATENEQLDEMLKKLDRSKHEWAKLELDERITLLEAMRDRIPAVAEHWVELASTNKGLTPGSPLTGEEWISGPWVLLAAINQILNVLRNLRDHKATGAEKLKTKVNSVGRTTVEVFPLNIFDKLLLSGVRAEVWMQKGVTPENLQKNTASSYQVSAAQRKGKVCVVLGAGNISSIAALDVLYKLFTEHEVCICKMNPVNAYLVPILEDIFQAFIARGFVAICRGGPRMGEYLCNHAVVEDIHITGSAQSHDAIVFGTGPDAAERKAANQPLNPRRITSELGAVCPTIIVPGPWSEADFKFQAAHVATQKLHNSGFNCIASQVLVLPQEWDGADTFREHLRERFAETPDRVAYYPGADKRLEDFTKAYPNAEVIKGPEQVANRVLIPLPPNKGGDSYAYTNEAFCPILCEQPLPGGDVETYLANAIKFCNEKLWGTLGSNIIIHPETLKELGPRFEELIGDLHYGNIGVNAWTGVGYLLPQNPWGAYPGHPLNDVQSGIGVVHNTFMFDKPERGVVYGPFRPYPRSMFTGYMSLLPKPPWFVNNSRAAKVGEKLVAFEYAPSWLKLPGIFWHALLG